MFCHNCGTPIPDDSVFCPECGGRQKSTVPPKPTKTTCPFCGEELEPDSLFCEHCGKSLAGKPLSAGSMPHGNGTAAPPPVPPMPQSPTPAERPVEPAAETGLKKTKTISPIMGIILGIVLSAFVFVFFGDSVRTLLGQGRGKPQDSGMEPTSSVTAKPTDEPTTTPEVTTGAVSEVTPLPDNTQMPESGSGTETLTEPASVQEPHVNTNTESAPLYDPQYYETSEPATLADFSWVTYDIYHGTLPGGIERLNDFREIVGGWKAYIIDETNGDEDATMDRLCRCNFGDDESGQFINIHWDYVHNNFTDEGYEENTPDSLYNGAWENGTFEGLGPGRVTITDFWAADGHEYAHGRLIWPDGIQGSMFLVRP